MQCPQCKNDVPVTEAQFGALYTCPKCVAVYFVGFDGQPEFGSMDMPIAETTEESFTTHLNTHAAEDVPSIDIPVQTYESFSEAPVVEMTEADPHVNNDFNNQFNSDFNLETFSPAESEVAVEVAKPRAMGHSNFAAVAQEITDYGNQEEVISSINYDVVIKGLDTKEVMQAFKDAIEDSKFAWLTQDILNQIKNGEVTLKSLNPIQAFVLATRIQFLDLEIEWSQNVAF